MLNKFDKREKYFINLQLRAAVIEKELKSLPLIKLDKPYKNGYRIKLVLREDIRNRKDAEEILKAVEIGYRNDYVTFNVQKVKAIRKGQDFIERIKKKKRIREDLRPSKRMINEKYYKELPDNLQKYFNLDVYGEQYRLHGRKFYYISLPHYYLVLKAKPNIITHTRKKGGPLQSELDFIDDCLRDYWRTTPSSDYERKYSWNKGEIKQDFKNQLSKFKKGEIDDIICKK